MEIVISALVGFVAGVLLLPSLSDGISLIRVVTRGATAHIDSASKQRLLFLVAAHNEELLIQDCVASLLRQHYPRDLYAIIVVADNCTDATALLAREAGADCLERHDNRRRGKPWAIAWALNRTDVSEFDALVLIDADSLVSPDFASELTKIPTLRSKGTQAFNGIRNPAESSLARMAAVLSTAYYRFAYPLKEKAGLNVPLTGAGMCLGTDVLDVHGWNAFSRSEDVELYVRLTTAGVPTRCAGRACVYSQETRSLRQSSSQRQRWRGGRLEILLRLAPAVIRSRRIGFHQKLDVLSELITPGPSVHLGATALMGVAIVVAGSPGAGVLLAVLLISLIRPVLLTLLAIRRQPEPAKALKAFLFLPIYSMWRLATEVLTLISAGSAPWIRTERHVPLERHQPVDRD